MFNLIKNKILSFLYLFIRPFFVKDIDSNEDFICGNCSKPVMCRVIFCSKECEEDFNKKFNNILT